MAYRDRAAVNDTDALPAVLADWRRTDRRRNALPTVTFGDWVLGTDADGNAVLTYAPTGDTTTLATKPTS